MDDGLATRLDEPDGGDHIHARLSGDNCYGEAKFARITGWLADNAITREDAHIRAYSDHVSDHPMLRFADEAVATTPSRKLRRLTPRMGRSEEHTSELQSLMRISYAVFCLKKKKTKQQQQQKQNQLQRIL